MAEAALGMEAVEGEKVGVACTDSAVAHLAPGGPGRHIVGDAAIDECDDVVSLHQLLQCRFHMRIVAGHVVVKKAGNRGRESSCVDGVEISCELVAADDDFFYDSRIDEPDHSDDLSRDLCA